MARDDKQASMRTGALAKRAGVTVRTLHHYDEIGLLKPSARTDSGYRLYTAGDIARLHHVQLLKNLGFGLSEIKRLLAEEGGSSFEELLADNIVAVDARIKSAVELRDQLLRLRDLCEQGALPDTEAFLDNLELCNAYERYFTRRQLQELRFYTLQPQTRADWRTLLEELEQLRNLGATPEDTRCGELAVRWMEQLEEDTAGDPELLCKLTLMADRESVLQGYLGVDSSQVAFIQHAFLEQKLAIFRRSLSPAVYDHLARHYAQQMERWPPLLARINQMLHEGVSPESPEGQKLGREWLAMFEGYAGSDTEAQAEVRKVQMTQPDLRRGSWLGDAQIMFLQRSVSTLTGRHAPGPSSQNE